VIEEFLQGTELSYMVMTDGETILPLASSQDYKRRFDHQQGPNTGGMGAISPSPILTPELEKKILSQIIEPTVEGLKSQQLAYCGFLYAGLMVTPAGEPKVLEYNCRLGDPETQALMMRLQGDLAEACVLATKGRLQEAEISWDTRKSVCVVMVSETYPAANPQPAAIEGLRQSFGQEIKIFHAATIEAAGRVMAHGGRILGVSSLGEDYSVAKNRAYGALKMLTFEGADWRNDIGLL
jgi:phosphoribosylamine--glycine ligase